MALHFFLERERHFMIQRFGTQRFAEQVCHRGRIIDDAAHVKFVGPVQASLDVAVSRQSEAVAGIAEMIADRMDQTEGSCSSNHLHIS